MKFLVLVSVIAAVGAVPLPHDCDLVHPGLVHTGLLHGGFAHGAISYAAPVAQYTQVAHVAPVAQVAHHVAPVAPLAYAATPVALPPAEVKVPVTHTHVEVPIHEQVHYGTQNYVAGSTTAIHKPALSAPAIQPPSVLLSKITHHAPEVTVQKQEVPVERHTPNFVDQPYHAGTIVSYGEPEVKEVKVPTPYAQPIPVAHPVPVAQPFHVPTPIHTVNVHAAAPVAYQAAPVAAQYSFQASPYAIQTGQYAIQGTPYAFPAGAHPVAYQALTVDAKDC